MKVHLIKWKSIEDFFAVNARSKVSFERFKETIKHAADWESINDVKQTFGTADPIGNDRIVFNVGGNNYRLICSFWFGPRMVHLYVKWIGTHAAYTKICKENLQYTIDLLVNRDNMKNRPYTIIRSKEQYTSYCDDLEKLAKAYKDDSSQELLDLIDTITLLIEKYDEENTELKEIDPIQLLKSLMSENNISQKELAEFLKMSKGHVSDILHYKKGLSKNVIRVLSDRFKVRQSAFNRPYKLTSEINKHYRNASLMNSKKDLEKA